MLFHGKLLFFFYEPMVNYYCYVDICAWDTFKDCLYTCIHEHVLQNLYWKCKSLHRIHLQVRLYEKAQNIFSWASNMYGWNQVSTIKLLKFFRWECRVFKSFIVLSIHPCSFISCFYKKQLIFIYFDFFFLLVLLNCDIWQIKQYHDTNWLSIIVVCYASCMIVYGRRLHKNIITKSQNPQNLTTLTVELSLYIVWELLQNHDKVDVQGKSWKHIDHVSMLQKKT